MSIAKRLHAPLIAALLAMPLVASPAKAEPLNPLTPNELQYLEQLHAVFAASHDPAAFRSDGELLTLGQYVCAKKDVGVVGQAATFQTPAISQLALIYLCP